MLRRFVEIFLSIPAPLAVAAVFLVTAGETAFFLGLLLPGELAVILGGVLASQERVPLLAALLAAVIGPITGDSIGYFLGRFTAFLRSSIPAAAGAARLPYGRFRAGNIAAGERTKEGREAPQENGE